MHNKTVVFDAQKEIADLKRRVQQLENEKIQYGQPLKVSDYPAQPPIFGPQNIPAYDPIYDWPSLWKNAQAVGDNQIVVEVAKESPYFLTPEGLAGRLNMYAKIEENKLD